MKKYVRFITPLVVTLVIVSFILYHNFVGKIKPNDQNANGNTTGNLYNSGLVCEYNGKIYYSNAQDEGALYVMTTDLQESQKLTNDRVSYINVAGNYIIYSRQNNLKQSYNSSALEFNNVGIYRMDLDGDNVVRLDKTPVGMVHQYGNTVHFQQYEKTTAYSYAVTDLEGKETKRISSEAIPVAAIYGDTLYYTGVVGNNNIFTRSLSTGETKTLVEGSYYQVMVVGDRLYCMDVANKYAIVSMNLDGSDKKTIVSDRCFTYNISENGLYVYYQVDDGKNNRICMKNLTTLEETTLLTGDFKNINLSKEYVFFQDTTGSSSYHARIGEVNINLESK